MRTADVYNVLRLVCRCRPVSRAELAHRTKFASSYIGAIVRAAQSRGFVVER